MNYAQDDKGIATWPTLYKTSSAGKEQEWTIKVAPILKADKDDEAVISVTHGQVDGKMQLSVVKVEKGKNLGKKNETTAVAQAVSQADSKWLKQKDKGYAAARGGSSMALKPMLAHKYEDNKAKVVFPSVVQPKLDGVRCITHKHAGVVEMWSRQGKPFTGLSHIRLALLEVMPEGHVWDGELYAHGVPFQSIISWVKRDQPDSAKVEYHIYDAIGEGYFTSRYPFVLPFRCDSDFSLKQVAYHTVQSHNEVEDYHERFVAEGYEGAMLRVGACYYKQGYRSRDLLKVKAFQEDDFVIVDVEPGVGKMANQGIFICSTAGDFGRNFSVKPKGRDSLREYYLEKKKEFIGKMLTVIYFSMTDGDNPVPRFPVGKCVRNYD